MPPLGIDGVVTAYRRANVDHVARRRLVGMGVDLVALLAQLVVQGALLGVGRRPLVTESANVVRRERSRVDHDTCRLERSAESTLLPLTLQRFIRSGSLRHVGLGQPQPLQLAKEPA